MSYNPMISCVKYVYLFTLQSAEELKITPFDACCSFRYVQSILENRMNAMVIAVN
jgi:hypothetical protein